MNVTSNKLGSYSRWVKEFEKFILKKGRHYGWFHVFFLLVIIKIPEMLVMSLWGIYYLIINVNKR